jgi:hypothetical protein
MYPEHVMSYNSNDYQSCFLRTANMIALQIAFLNELRVLISLFQVNYNIHICRIARIFLPTVRFFPSNAISHSRDPIKCN